MSKQGLGTVFSALALVATLAGTVVYAINANGSYYGDFSLSIVMVAVASIVVMVAPMVLSRTVGERQWLDAFYPLGAVLAAVSAVMFIAGRVESVGIILGSQLEAGNQLAYASLYQAFAGVGCFLAAMLLTGISGFFRQTKAQGRV